jgi:MFS family permease
MQSPGAARHPNAFYGWYMLLFCTIVRGFTAPGQTIGVSAFTDDLIESLGTSRSAVATAYLVGTLTGAAALPFVGRWIDRAGVKHTLTIVSVGFAAAVALTGTVQNIVMLAFAFVGLRMLGQGSLSLIGSQGVVMWFERRRGFALALNAMGTVAILSLAPLTFAALIGAFGWRSTWVILGVFLAITLVPIARFAIIDRPEQIDQVPDGKASDQPANLVRGRSYTVSEAVRTPAFWTITAVAFMAGAVSTGLTFHNTDLLGEQGLTKTQAAAIFIPQLIGSVSSSFVVGSLTDRMSARPLMFFGGAMLGLGTFLATVAEPGVMSAVYGLTLGLGGGAIGALSGALYPKWFGIDHIGSIKGIATTANVGASAIGPLILSIGNDISGSYEPIVIACAIASVAVAVVALVVPTPVRT